MSSVKIALRSGGHVMGDHVFDWDEVERVQRALCVRRERGWIACQTCAGCDSLPFVGNYDGRGGYFLVSEVEPRAGELVGFEVVCTVGGCAERAVAS